MLRWSPTLARKIEAVRDRLLFGLGTDEELIMEDVTTARTWRKPLRIDEINQMGRTPEVLERPGRA